MNELTQREIEVIQELCAIKSLAWNAIDPNSTTACDCICSKRPIKDHSGFRHSDLSLDYVRKAVLRALKEDGLKVPKGFDPETGKEI